MVDDSFPRKRLAVFLVLAVQGKVVNELLNVSSRNSVDTKMSDCGINSRRQLFHFLIRRVPQVDFCVLLKPLLRKFLEFYVCGNLSLKTFFLKKDCLLFHLPFNLFLCHTLCGSPRHLLKFLLAVYVIAAADADLIRRENGNAQHKSLPKRYRPQRRTERKGNLHR